MWLFLSFEHLEASVGFLISILLCLREYGSFRRGRWGNSWLVDWSEQSNVYEICCVTRARFVMPPNNINSRDCWSETAITSIIMKKWGLPWFLSGNEFTCQCGRRVWSLIWEDPTCLEAAKPLGRNYWACMELQLMNPCATATETCVPYSPCSATGDATVMKSLRATTRE